MALNALKVAPPLPVGNGSSVKGSIFKATNARFGKKSWGLKLDLEARKEWVMCKAAVQEQSIRSGKKIDVLVPPLLEDVTDPPSRSIITPYLARVVSIEKIAGVKGEPGEVCHIVIDHDHRLRFLEGQFLRAYSSERQNAFFSIASSRYGDYGDAKTVSLCVKREGDVSIWLCDRKVGDSIPITGPFGKNLVFPSTGTRIMVSSSTGVAPFRAHIERMFLENNRHCNFNGLAWLFVDQLWYDDEFQQVLLDNPNHFKYDKCDKELCVVDNVVRRSDEIAKLLLDGGFIYFAGRLRDDSMAQIRDSIGKSVEKMGFNWEEQLREWRFTAQWCEEVYGEVV